jgi:CheY-like chemotaxis protein
MALRILQIGAESMHPDESQRCCRQNGKWIMRILVAEDNEQTAAQLAHFLRTLGYEVMIASDGPSALEQARATSPDAMLVDIGLPVFDSWQVVERLREQTLPKRPFFIAITGHGTREDLLRSEQVGIDLHLTKPVDPEELAQVLRRFQKVLAPE